MHRRVLGLLILALCPAVMGLGDAGATSIGIAQALFSLLLIVLVEVWLLTLVRGPRAPRPPRASGHPDSHGGP
jgi:uncharacterized membrane protein YtjA (UPF0391 family)